MRTSRENPTKQRSARNTRSAFPAQKECGGRTLGLMPTITTTVSIANNPKMLIPHSPRCEGAPALLELHRNAQSGQRVALLSDSHVDAFIPLPKGASFSICLEV